MRANTTANLLTAGDMSGDLTSAPQKLGQIYGYALQAVYTSTPAGTIKLQASIDGADYTDIPGSSFVLTGAGNTIWNVASANYLYVRAVWTHTAGSLGLLTITPYVRGF